MIFHVVETVTHFLPLSQQKRKELATNGCIQLVLRFWKLKADRVKMYIPQEQFAALLLNDKNYNNNTMLINNKCNLFHFTKNNKLISWNVFTFLYSN